jgi:tetratricopeptide (TPR) repeat protein
MKYMKKLLFIAALLLSFVSASAQTKAEADSAYVQERYEQAISLYNKLLETGASASVYYNLGNAYYRTGDMAHAILAYERAYLMEPGDADIRFNLQLARTKTIDKIVPESEMFFITWFRQMIDWYSADQWGRAVVVCFALFVVSLLLYFFAGRMLWRKVGFGVGVCTLILAVLFHIFAYQQKQKLLVRTHAIVMSSSLTVKSTPSTSGTDLFVLHEGTKVEITDDTMKDWKEIRLADGKVGWVPVKTIERI